MALWDKENNRPNDAPVIAALNEGTTPEWAKGKGWAFGSGVASNGIVSIDNCGGVTLAASWGYDDYLLKYATPEKARQVADAILDGLL